MTAKLGTHNRSFLCDSCQVSLGIHLPKGLAMVLDVGKVAYNVQIALDHTFHAALVGVGWYGHVSLDIAGRAVPSKAYAVSLRPFESVISDSMDTCR